MLNVDNDGSDGNDAACVDDGVYESGRRRDPRMPELARACAQVLNARIADWHDERVPASHWEDDHCPRLLTMMVKQGRYLDDEVRSHELYMLINTIEYSRIVTSVLDEVHEHAKRLPPDAAFPLAALGAKER